MNPELAGIQTEVIALGARVGASERFCRVPVTRSDDGSPHIEHAGGVYRYIVTERGLTHESRETRDRDELLYWLLSDITFGLATRHELENRRPGIDGRRLIFAHQLDNLGRLEARWRARRAAEIADTLAQYPYHDEPPQHPTPC